MRVGPLDECRFDHRARPQAGHFERRRGHEALSSDVCQRHLAFGAKRKCRHWHGNMLLGDNAAGDDCRNDAVRAGLEHDVLDASRFGAVRSSENVLIFADAKDGVIGRRERGWNS